MKEGWTQTILAPGLTIGGWYDLRDDLDPARLSTKWRDVIRSIERRFEERFIKPADALIARDKRRKRLPVGPGFAVLALDCVLIEAIIGFERGSHTQFRETASTFETFLAKTPPFAPDFDVDDRAETFSWAVRNAIVHDGETRSGWVVWKSSPFGGLVGPTADGRLRIYRDAFHSNVKEYVGSYFTRLFATGEDGKRARAAFKRRMDELCEESAPGWRPKRRR